MAIPNDKLQKLVQEIETQAVLAQQQINVVKGQISLKQRDLRMLQLTSSEVASLPTDTKVYEGVGKMFVFSPTDEVERRLKKQGSDIESEVDNLGKKLHYLETTHKNSREHIEQIFRSGGAA